MKLTAYTSVLGAIEQDKRMDVVANNLANAATPGYRKVGIRFSDFMKLETYTKDQQGPVRQTGNPLDVAIVGKGYFRVQTDRGERYTRAGNLTLDNQGQLVTQEGWPVLGQGGPIQIEGSDIHIDAQGQIFDGETVVDTLDVVTFPEGTRLLHDGNNLLVPADPAAMPVPANDYSIEQGALEGANFSVIEEMTALIDTMRTFETCEKLMKSSTDIDRQIISQLGKA